MYVHVIILTGLGEQVSSHVHNTLHDTVVYFQEIEIKVMEHVNAATIFLNFIWN